jgi:sec-independent protein translocase protein TatB
VFDIGPSHLMVLAIVGVLVLGPEKLPSLARDAARMLRSLRELAAGARVQLEDGFGPDLGRELASLDPRKLNPKAFLHDTILGDLCDATAEADPTRTDQVRIEAGETVQYRPMPYPR